MEEKYKIHAFYVLSILISIIVLLVTIEWSNIPGLRDYISFALTVFSIGLAFVAIIYSMYSNTTLSRSLTLLESSSEKLSRTSEKLSTSTEQLSSNVSDIPTAIKKVESRITETHDLLSNLNVSGDGINDDGYISTHLSSEALHDFEEFTSYNSLIVMLIMEYSYSNKEIVAMDEALLKIMRVHFEYAFSAYINMRAIGLFEADFETSSENSDGDSYNVVSYRCYDLHPYFKGSMEAILDKKAKKIFSHDEALIAECKKNREILRSCLDSMTENSNRV